MLSRTRFTMGLFGKSKPVDPKVQCQEWCKRIRKEGYAMDRQINGIKREEQKVTRSIKEAAKRGDKDVCRSEVIFFCKKILFTQSCH